ncbi:MAG TPA: amino acid ABC transporter permease [Methanocorpusculum sp.]|nr:amino acid ABC transporter permease [Methanocorpusculum sp.]
MVTSIESVTTSIEYLLGGLLTTIELVAVALAIGFALGIILMLGQMYGPKIIRGIVHVYVWFFRGLPNLILLFLFYFAFFPMVGLGNTPSFIIATIVLGMRSAAYQSQIFRGAIQSISEGQMTAALSLGMTKWQTIKSIMIPQALRIALPSWANEYPVLLTDSAIASAIGVTELLTRTGHRIAATGDSFALYFACAVIFILLNYGGMFLIQKIEKHFRIPGLGNNDGDEQI